MNSAIATGRAGGLARYNDLPRQPNAPRRPARRQGGGFLWAGKESFSTLNAAHVSPLGAVFCCETEFFTDVQLTVTFKI